MPKVQVEHAAAMFQYICVTWYGCEIQNNIHLRRGLMTNITSHMQTLLQKQKSSKLQRTSFCKFSVSQSIQVKQALLWHAFLGGGHPLYLYIHQGAYIKSSRDVPSTKVYIINTMKYPNVQSQNFISECPNACLCESSMEISLSFFPPSKYNMPCPQSVIVFCNWA